ncbi:hypothetical protein ACFFQW_45665 [Umezawaea endophytica]|uniref:Uncharacterized protein n=1 Tax=Umezawaea endophytica TaxID=1654476 RepID=A0A9X2VH16_9PSEU|nr:hypothetical protein [Umezawaea endophytica]MCS7476441.1 hypothetical protein [Umezawaea endophytica]
MRLIRLGSVPTEVGADVRAALSTWGAGDAVLGGVALLGVQPPGSPKAVDAVVVLPRGVVVVVGVDLPDPAVRLEAPLSGQWRIDGWPLVRPDGAVSPAAEALEAALAVGKRIQEMRAEPLPVTTVVAVGPYVGTVVQPTVDLNRGVRVLHPKPTSLLAAVRELATSDRPCSVGHAEKLLAVLSPTGTPPTTRDLLAEGFADAITSDLASASTVLIPKLPTAGKTKQLAAKAPKLLPYAAAALVALLAVVGIIVATSDDSSPRTAAPTTSEPLPTTVVVDGENFTPRGTGQDTDCAAHSFGDVSAWLSKHRCTALHRAQYETKIGDRPVGVAVAEVALADALSAQELHGVVATAGSGGITTLLKEGKSWPNSPRSFDRSAFASTVKNTRVLLAQAVWVEGDSTATDPDLLKAAERALRLPASQ